MKTIPTTPFAWLRPALLCLAVAFASCNKTSNDVQPQAAGTSAEAITSSAIAATMPAGAEVKKPLTFSGTCGNVYKFIASVDGFTIREQVVSGQTSWSFPYTFSQAGDRTFLINAFDVNGNIVATKTYAITVLPEGGNAGVVLQQVIMRRCAALAPKNRPYVFDGVGDCWGYVRQVWNAVLYDGGEHTEDYAAGYDKARWVREGAPYLPVGDASSTNPNWRKVTDWNDMPTGMPISSDQGHAWGDQWHGAIYAGKANGVHMMWDCSGRSSRNGAYNRPISESPRISNGYYYIPLYRKLKGLN